MFQPIQYLGEHDPIFFLQMSNQGFLIFPVKSNEENQIKQKFNDNHQQVTTSFPIPKSGFNDNHGFVVVAKNHPKLEKTVLKLFKPDKNVYDNLCSNMKNIVDSQSGSTLDLSDLQSKGIENFSQNAPIALLAASLYSKQK